MVLGLSMGDLMGEPMEEPMEEPMGELVRDSELMGELWEWELVGEFELEQTR
jgi:hypothetical protein